MLLDVSTLATDSTSIQTGRRIPGIHGGGAGTGLRVESAGERRASRFSPVTVVADTSPLQYAVEIDFAHTVFMLYGRIVVPVAVSSEMRHPGARAI